MTPALIWILAGLVLAGAELIVPGVFLIWAGLGAVSTGLVLLAWPGLSFAATVWVFVVVQAAWIVLALALRRRRPQAEALNTPASLVEGRFGVVIEASGPLLRVRIGDSDWWGTADDAVAEGDRVVVLGVDGTHVRLRRIEEPHAG